MFLEMAEQESRGRGASSLLVRIHGFSAYSCGGEVGSGCCRCYRKCPPSDTAGLLIHLGYYDGWGYQGRSKAAPPLVLQKGWSHAGAEVRGQHPSEAALPPTIHVTSANRGAASYPLSRFHVAALERKFPPLHSLLTYHLLHLCPTYGLLPMCIALAK